MSMFRELRLRSRRFCENTATAVDRHEAAMRLEKLINMACLIMFKLIGCAIESYRPSAFANDVLSEH